MSEPGDPRGRTRRTQLAVLGGGGALAACGVGQTEPAASGPAGGAPATVEYGQKWDPGSAPAVQAWLERFNQKHAGRATVVQGDQGDDDKQAALAASNSLPDVLAVHHTRAQNRVKLGWVRELQSFVDKDKSFDIRDFTPPSLFAYRSRGKLHALPFDEGPKVLWYNLDLFDQAGVKYPTKEWTFDDWLDAARRLTRGEGDTKTYGLSALPGSPFSPSHGVLVKPFGGRWVSEQEEKSLLDAPETVRGVQWWLDLLHRHRVVPTAEETARIMAGQTFGNPFFGGRAAMLVTGTWSATQAKSVAQFRYDVAHYPKGPRRLVTGAEGSGLAISRDSKAPEAAWLWVSDFLSKEGQIELFGKSGRGSPARASGWTAFEQSPVAMPSVKILLPILREYAEHEQPIGPRTPDIQRAVAPLWTEVLQGSRGLSEYVTEAKRLVDPLLPENRLEV